MEKFISPRTSDACSKIEIPFYNIQDMMRTEIYNIRGTVSHLIGEYIDIISDCKAFYEGQIEDLETRIKELETRIKELEGRI